jgi:hypothetical protein|tara:strand:- start:1023 stop:1529 length:507 start_codon:yes stop_codon:yes gene_type:complete
MNTEIPLLTLSFIEWLEKQDTKTKTLLEFGSGDSTIYFSQKFARVKSFEDDINWLHHVEKRLLPANIHNVELYQLNLSFYLQHPNIADDVQYVLIDNNPQNISRLTIAKILTQKLNYKGTLILDNSNWNPEAYFYLRKFYSFYEDFGWFNYAGEETITSVFSMAFNSI